MPDTSRPEWHWPVFERILCGAMSDRERLGLPNHYVPDRYSQDYTQAYAKLRALPQVTLATLCEDASLQLVERLAAGNLLAILGDPRISTFTPKMIGITGRPVQIGLPSADIDRVLVEFAGLGLDRKWIAKECPRHTMQVRNFAIGKYPVTNSEYRDFLLESGHAELPSNWQFRRFPIEYANHPVYSISANSADAYCRWLSAKTGRRFRLPTEAEWEFAAAGPSGREYPWGDMFNADFANTAETGLFQSSPVGVFVEGNSIFGASDLAGNVEEYVADAYAAYPGGEFITDHLVEIHGTYRVARGGSFARFRDLARTRRRHGHNPRSAAYAMGMRLAEDQS